MSRAANEECARTVRERGIVRWAFRPDDVGLRASQYEGDVQLSESGKVVLIGLDGATFRVLGPLVEAGVMPTVARMMNEGAWGNLMTTRPPVTCPAWPTMFTGVNPGKHGVFSFSYRDPKSGRTRTASGGDIQAPKIWDMIGEAGRKVGILNVPITYPARPVNGAMMTGFVSPDDSRNVFHPESLDRKMRERFADLSLNWAVLGYRPSEPAKREEHIRRINELMRLRIAQFEFILDEHPMDFCFFVHEYPDRVHHLFYHLLDPDYEAYNVTANYRARELLYEGYGELDRSVARVMERFGPEANYLLVSDHGFDGVSQWVYVNNLLAQHGLLRTHAFKAWADVISRKCRVPVSVRKLVGLEQSEAWHRQDPFRATLIDYARSRAFAGPQLEHSVYINLKGRCPNGTVDSGQEYERVQREIIEVLSSATDPRTGEKVFQGVWPREEIYDGKFVEQAPDVIYELSPGYMVSNAILPAALVGQGFLRDLRPGWDISGYHRPEGVFVAFGPAFRSVQGLEASISDVSPTVLYLMGLPIPGYMDGRVMEDALAPDLLASRPRRSCDVDPVWEGSEGASYSDQELAEVTRRLEELGYL